MPTEISAPLPVAQESSSSTPTEVTKTKPEARTWVQDAVTVFQVIVPGLDSGFTRWNLFFFVVAMFVPQIYPVVFCTTWGVFVSFNIAPLLDRTAFPRLAESLGMKSQLMFHVIYNFVAHALPCLITAAYPPKRLRWWWGLIAAGIHLGWGLCISRGTLQLNETYIPMKPAFWTLMWWSAVVTEVSAPFWVLMWSSAFATEVSAPFQF